MADTSGVGPRVIRDGQREPVDFNSGQQQAASAMGRALHLPLGANVAVAGYALHRFRFRSAVHNREPEGGALREVGTPIA